MHQVNGEGQISTPLGRA